jgi:hypothetical protein
MRKELIVLTAGAALVVAGIVWISPKATVITNEASTEVYGVDILGLTKKAQDLPVEQYAAN